MELIKMLTFAHNICRPTMAAVFAVLMVSCGGSGPDQAPPDQAKPVVVYSARAEQLIKPIFDAYTAETGVPIRYITDSEQPLIQKLKAEGETGSADLLLTVDAGNLWYAAEEGVLRPTHSDILQANIPDYLSDPENMWFAMSVRAHTIVYDTRKPDGFVRRFRPRPGAARPGQTGGRVFRQGGAIDQTDIRCVHGGNRRPHSLHYGQRTAADSKTQSRR